MRVLVVSEDATERLRAVSALHLHAEAEVEVVEAASGEQAHRVLREDPGFDVLVVDGDLYPRGGFAQLYSLRAQGELTGTPTPPAVLLLGREQDRWLADWAGANAVLLKPISPFALARVVDELVGTAAAQQGATESSDQVSDLVEAGHDREAGLTPG